jgi:hydroxypyruvate isomerase
MWLCVAAVMVVAAVSCGNPPEDRIRRARTALAEARAAGKVEKWAPDEMASAAAAMAAAEKELSAQNRRFAAMRDYAEASELFWRAAEDIEMATKAAQEAKDRAERTAREALEAAGSAIGHAQATLMIVPVSRDARPTVDRIGTDLGKAESRLGEVNRLIASEQYKEAIALAEEILDQVTSLIRTASRAARK